MVESTRAIPVICSGIAAGLLKKIDDEYKVLLLKRASSVLHGAWCYIGGSIEEGEKAWEAAFREIREETGITEVSLYVSNAFDEFYSPAGNYIYKAPVFVGYVADGQNVVLNDEHSEYRWLSFEEAAETAALPGNDEVLKIDRKTFCPQKTVRMASRSTLKEEFR